MTDRERIEMLEVRQKLLEAQIEMLAQIVHVHSETIHAVVGNQTRLVDDQYGDEEALLKLTKVVLDLQSRVYQPSYPQIYHLNNLC